MIKISSSVSNHIAKCLILIAVTLSLYLFFIVLYSRNLADYDLWGYLSFGRVFWEESYFPYHDIFAYTPTKPLWVYHEWLTGVVFYALAKYLGPASLQLLRYTLAILSIYLMYLIAIKRSHSVFYALIVLIPSMTLISFGYVPVRAQVFTYFFFILTLYILERSKITGNVKSLRWLPFIQIIWCNFHGGFVSGIGLIFLYALGESLAQKKITTPYFMWGMIASFSTLINPYGIEYWIYMINAISMPRPEITEWYSVTAAFKAQIHIFPTSMFLIMSFLIILITFMRKKRDITELLVLCVVIYLGIAHIRHDVIFAFVFGSYMPAYLSDYHHEWPAKAHAFKHLMMRLLPIIFSSALIVTYFYFHSIKAITFIPCFNFSVSSDFYPTKAMDWMKAHHIKGNIVPHFEWGEYLMWSYYPDCRVAMDGRYESVYQDGFYKDYYNFIHAKNGWNIFLNKYPHDILLLKAGSKTYSLMSHEKDWRIVYLDKISVVFLKNK